MWRSWTAPAASTWSTQPSGRQTPDVSTENSTSLGQMVATPDEWLEEQTGRIAARQRARADNLKLIATFAAGIAATLVASALQTGQTPSWHDRAASVGLTVTVVLTALVLLADRLSE